MSTNGPVYSDPLSPLSITREGWLEGDGVAHISTGRSYALDVPEPLGPVWHTSDGLRPLVDPPELVRPDAEASWHLAILRDGRLIQCASFLVGTWHVGKRASYETALIDGVPSRNVNRVSLGIELQNAGRLRRLWDGQLYAWPYEQSPWYRVPIEEGEKVAGEYDPKWDGWWHRFTPAQIAAAIRFVRAGRDRFGWRSGQCCFGHWNFSQGGKQDPGPLWTFIHLGTVLRAVYGADA